MFVLRKRIRYLRPDGTEHKNNATERTKIAVWMPNRPHDFPGYTPSSSTKRMKLTGGRGLFCGALGLPWRDDYF